MEEFLEVVDREGRVLSIAPKSLIHGNPSMLHKVVRVIVFNSKGEILLRKLASEANSPGKWATSASGHVLPGEDIFAAAKRKLFEKLGIHTDNLFFLYTYIYSNDFESELVYTYFTVYDGPFNFNKNEVEEIAFWNIEDIQRDLKSDIFIDSFKFEFLMYLHTCFHPGFNLNYYLKNRVSPI